MPPSAAELGLSDPLESQNLTARKQNVTQGLVKILPNNTTFDREVVKPALAQEQTVGFSKWRDKLLRQANVLAAEDAEILV